MNAPRHSFTISRVSRVLDMLNAWFVIHTMAPGYREISRLSGVPIQAVGKCLDRLQEMGLITYEPGVRYSIRMTEIVLPQDVLLRLCHKLGWTVLIPPPQG